MKIHVQIDDGPVQRLLARLGDRARNLSPAFREIGANIAADAQLRFKDSRDPYGTPWQRLKASTIARRRKGRGVGGAKPLLDTGRLRDSLTPGYRLIPGGVEVGTNVEYAAIHNFGGRAGRGLKTLIQRRSFIATPDRGLPREYGEIIRDALNRHFAKAVGP